MRFITAIVPRWGARLGLWNSQSEAAAPTRGTTRYLNDQHADRTDAHDWRIGSQLFIILQGHAPANSRRKELKQS